MYIWTGATPPASPTANVATTSYNATSLTASTLYNWYIAPRNASGYLQLVPKKQSTVFTTAAIPVPATYVINTAPVDGTTLATQTTATLSWNAAAMQHPMMCISGQVLHHRPLQQPMLLLLLILHWD